jgi:hypothetical protein
VARRRGAVSRTEGRIPEQRVRSGREREEAAAADAETIGDAGGGANEGASGERDRDEGEHEVVSGYGTHDGDQSTNDSVAGGLGCTHTDTSYCTLWVHSP